jgi:hypothetical protein
VQGKCEEGKHPEASDLLAVMLFRALVPCQVVKWIGSLPGTVHAEDVYRE